MRYRDYPFRCFIRREDSSRLLADLGGNIDYESFKDEITSKSRFRAWLYGVVWGVMKHLKSQDWKAFSAAETAEAEIALAVDVRTATVPEEVGAVMSQVPAEVIAKCPARLVVAVAAAIDKAYHAGRARCGAEILDDSVWVDSPVERLIPLAMLKAIKISDTPGTVDGTDIKITYRCYTADYTETF